MSTMRFVEYHSKEWEQLVDNGWVTHRVETLADGTRMAIMIRHDAKVSPGTSR